MKVQIVYLSASDDIDSTRDMLGWVQAPRAVLVWPDRGQILHRDLDLVLLKRYAQKRHLSLGLLTFDSAIRHRAATLGFPLFETLEDLPEEQWSHFRAFDRDGEGLRDVLSQPLLLREGTPDWAQSLGIKSSRIQLGILLFIVVFLGAALLPSATVILSPPKQLERVVFDIRLIDEARFSTGIEQIRVQGSTDLQASGEASMPVTASKGFVTFKNLSTTAIAIPRNMGIRAQDKQGMRFRTSVSGELPAEIGAEIELPIEAIDLGEDGNLPAGTLFSAEAALGLMVSITNSNPITGGKNEMRRSVAAVDLARLEDKLIQQLLTQAERAIAATLGSEHAVLRQSAAVDRVFAQNFSYGEGEPAEQIRLDLDLNVDVIIYEIGDLLVMIDEAIEDELDTSRVLYASSVIMNDVQYIANEEESLGVLRIEGAGESYMPFSRQTVLSIIRGRTPRVAQKDLEIAIELENPPVLTLIPSWLPFLPLIDNRIVVLYEWD